MRTRGATRAATVVLALEAIGTVALAAWQVVALTSGDTDSVVSAVALIVLTIVGAAALAAFAAATWREVSWGRSGGIVAQLLILAIALGATTGAYAHPLIGAALAVPGVVGLAALILAVRRAAKTRADEEDARDADRR